MAEIAVIFTLRVLGSEKTGLKGGLLVGFLV
jgi:hypothetical protein